MQYIQYTYLNYQTSRHKCMVSFVDQLYAMVVAFMLTKDDVYNGWSFSFSESSMMCFNAISDLSIHQSECGTTLSEITEYYLYKAAVIYEVDQTVCSGSSNIP